MTPRSTVLIPLVLLLGATVSCFAEEAPKQTFTCTAKTFNDCLMEAPCSAWKRLGPKDYKLETKIIFRGNPVEGETISGGTMGDILETKCEKKQNSVGCSGGNSCRTQRLSCLPCWMTELASFQKGTWGPGTFC